MAISIAMSVHQRVSLHLVWGILDMITGGHTEHTGYVWMETSDKGQASEALCTNTLLYV